MSGLDEAREEINRIDEEMARLFEKRMQASRKVAEFKEEHALSVKDEKRENELIKRNRKNIRDPELEPYYIDFIKEIFKVSCSYQSRLISGMKVCYCGIEGAFAYSAARKMFPEAELISMSDFADAYKAVETGEYDTVVLPIENSYAGEVGSVMDLIFSGSLYINQVTDIDISHNLMSVEGADLSTVKKVISHPQALHQCEKYLRKTGLKAEEYSNTALAARYVSEKNDPQLAAIASKDAAELYGLKVLERNINDNRNNTTRFAAFSRTRNVPKVKRGIRPPVNEENFILVFTVKNEAGALAQTLNIIGAHGFNMRNLRSRPMKDLQWNYYFYIEAEGNINNENGKALMRELSAICARLKLVGSYVL